MVGAVLKVDDADELGPARAKGSMSDITGVIVTLSCSTGIGTGGGMMTR